MYLSKFPLDPFQRDQVFKDDANHLLQDMRKHSKQAGPQSSAGGAGQDMSSRPADNGQAQQAKSNDFNLLNVIKADYKMQQRQKEIVSVISDMSAQMS